MLHKHYKEEVNQDALIQNKKKLHFKKQWIADCFQFVKLEYDCLRLKWLLALEKKTESLV